MNQLKKKHSPWLKAKVALAARRGKKRALIAAGHSHSLAVLK